MASKKSVQPKILKELDSPEVRTTKQTFVGYHWRLEATPEFLSSVISTYQIPKKVAFEVPRPWEGAINDKVYAFNFPSMFSLPCM